MNVTEAVERLIAAELAISVEISATISRHLNSLAADTGLKINGLHIELIRDEMLHSNEAIYMVRRTEIDVSLPRAQTELDFSIGSLPAHLKPQA